MENIKKCNLIALLKSLYCKYNHNISFYLVFLMIFSPLAMFVYNYFHDDLGLTFWFNITKILGFSSLFFGGISFIVNLTKSMKKQGYFLCLCFIVVLILSFISTIESNNVELSYYGHYYTNNGFLSYILYSGFFLNATNIRKKDLKNLGHCICLMASIMSIVALLNNDFTYKFFYRNHNPYNGIFYHFNHFGYYLSILVTIASSYFIYEKKHINKFIYLFVYILLAFTLIINTTFGSYLAVLVSLIFVLIYALLNKKYFSICVALIIFLLLSLTVTNNGKKVVLWNFQGLYKDAEILVESNNKNDIAHIGTDRGMLWTNGLDFIKESPWLGYGPDNLLYKYNSIGISQGSPHNIIIEIAGYVGLPALIFYFIAVGVIIINCLIKIRTIGVEVITVCFASIAYLCSLLTGVTFFYTAPYFYVLLGIMFGQLYIEKQEINDNKRQIKVDFSKCFMNIKKKFKFKKGDV